MKDGVAERNEKWQRLQTHRQTDRQTNRRNKEEIRTDAIGSQRFFSFYLDYYYVFVFVYFGLNFFTSLPFYTNLFGQYSNPPQTKPKQCYWLL